MGYKVNNYFDYLSLLSSDIFYNCKKLNKIIFESKKQDSINVTNNITFLGESAFENCKQINDVYYDPSMNYVSKCLFKNCIKLNYIKFSHNLNIIRESAFENCLSLKSISMPTELKTLEGSCFKNCSNLENINFYEKTNLISTSSFQNCDSFLIPNFSLVIHNDNNYVKAYFNSIFPLVKTYKMSLSNIINKYLNNAKILLSTSDIKIKEYTYPSIDIILTDGQNIVNVNNLINENISVDKVSQFRHLTIKFIFDSNLESYNSFIIKTQSLLLSLPSSNDSTYIQVYNEGAKNINVTNNLITTMNIIGSYCLVNSVSSIALLNDYRINFYKQQNISNYYISYSNNNFETSTQIISVKDQEDSLSNYILLGGSFNELIIYRKVPLNYMGIFLETLQINVSSALSLPILGETTQNMIADAYATINVPLSTVRNTFLYWSDGINVDDTIEEGVKFKVVNHYGWNDIYLTKAVVYDGSIPYNRVNSIMSRKEIRYDFIRYLALKIFKTSAGADLFRNNNQVALSLDNASNLQLRNKLSELENLGEFLNEYSPNNISRTIFRQLLSIQPERIIPNDGDWTNIPLYVGDKIYLKLIINPDINQNSVLGTYSVAPITQRSYLIDLNLISG